MNIIETHALSKSYGSATALRDCTLAIPEGHVVALVGPNGAGKSTLLNLSVGLAAPSAGEVTVLGGLRAGSAPALDGIAFVAQDTPLFKNLSAADLLHMTRNLISVSTRDTPSIASASSASPCGRRWGRCRAASRPSSR